MGLGKWDLQALQAGPEETMILRNWEIISIPMYVRNPRKQVKEKEIP